MEEEVAIVVMKTQEIDNGFLLISEANAKALAGTLPGPGRETLVVYKGQHYWLSRTMHYGLMRWSIRTTKWKLVNGRATLGA